MFNKIILIGNLTRDPEMRYTPQGTSVCNFGIAVNHKYKQGEEMKEEVTFINVVIFGKQADACGQYLNKGSSVLVEGRLQERRWETEEGQKRSKHEVVAQNVRFLSKKQGPADMVSPGEGENAAPVETTNIEPF
ncbi:MAG TPA: single-stranded DNA-binding protein [Nitrospirae bacterium]|nr:single-stranded DNA-binding protein [Nitrospirota bacterium]